MKAMIHTSAHVFGLAHLCLRTREFNKVYNTNKVYKPHSSPCTLAHTHTGYLHMLHRYVHVISMSKERKLQA